MSKAAADAMYDALVNNYGNPSSLHSKGLEAQHYVDAARRAAADSIGVSEREIFFTSGGTEANNTAVIGAALSKKRQGKRIVTTAVEHSSVIEACRYLEGLGFEVVYLPVNSCGAVEMSDLKEAVTQDTILVSVMYVNNETGTVQPVDKIARAIKRSGANALFHIDAVQAYGKLMFKNSRLGADMITFTAHKIHGPKGVGALYIKNGVRITPRLYGGMQQHKIRPGTEPAPAIAGFGAAIREIDYTNIDNIKSLNCYLRKQLENIDGIVINSPENALEYILNFSVTGIRSETMLHYLAEKGIYVSSGSACAKGQPSYVLTAMGLSKDLADSAVRVSFSRHNTTADIDALIKALRDGMNSLARKSSK